MQWGAGVHELCTGEGYSHCNLTSVLRTALGAVYLQLPEAWPTLWLGVDWLKRDTPLKGLLPL